MQVPGRGPGGRRTPGPRRRSVGAALTLLCALLVWAALLLPDELPLLTPGAFLRIPAEGLLAAVLLLLLPERSRRRVAIAFGLLLAVALVLTVADLGFRFFLDRRFDPLVDWSLIGPGVGVLRDTDGLGFAVGVVAGAVVLVVLVLVALPLATVRLTRAASRHRRRTVLAAGTLGAVWGLAAVTGLQVAPVGPVATAGNAGRLYDHVQQARADLRDNARFAGRLAHDPEAAVPGDRLLGGLAGKDVLLVFVESYGRVAVQGSSFSDEVDRTLDDGTARLARLGFSARSGFLTSPTFGAGSWLAHATLQSGMWVTNQQRYDDLVAGGRMTLTGAFGRAGWQTVFGTPAVRRPWPEGQAFYGYDRLVAANATGYAGPRFAWSTMPDQFFLEVFHRLVLAPAGRAPVMAEIDLTSSHHPWTRVPPLVPWAALGDGSVFDRPEDTGPSRQEIYSDPQRVRDMYGRSIVYSIDTLVSYVEHYPDDDLVMVLLGDHQPHSYVTGARPGHDVPVTILAHDPAVLQRIADWGWQPGLRPRPDAPVWRMDAFRDRFLAAFGTG